MIITIAIDTPALPAPLRACYTGLGESGCSASLDVTLDGPGMCRDTFLPVSRLSTADHDSLQYLSICTKPGGGAEHCVSMLRYVGCYMIPTIATLRALPTIIRAILCQVLSMYASVVLLASLSVVHGLSSCRLCQTQTNACGNTYGGYVDVFRSPSLIVRSFFMQLLRFLWNDL